MPKELPPPLGGPPPAEINLPQAPLVRVLAQVRFPGILKIENKDVVSSFQEEIRRDYPLFEQQATQVVEVQVGPGGPAIKQAPATNWRFQDADRNWRLSLSTDALSIEVEKYTSRDDFLARWAGALAAAQRIFDPRIAVRIGMRYIDRVVDEPFASIDELIHTEILGFARPPLREHVHHALSEATLAVEEGEVLLRWGIMPANGTVDPNVLPPVTISSWILDIDVFSGVQRPFENVQLGKSFRALAERAYTVFRYMTKPQFLKTYGDGMSDVGLHATSGQGETRIANRWLGQPTSNVAQPEIQQTASKLFGGLVVLYYSHQSSVSFCFELHNQRNAFGRTLFENALIHAFALEGRVTTVPSQLSLVWHPDPESKHVPAKARLPEFAAQALLRKVQSRSGLTLEEIAPLLGVSRRSLQHWRAQGHISARKEQRLRSLCDALDSVPITNSPNMRRRLLDRVQGKVRPYDLLAEGRFDAAYSLITGSPAPPHLLSQSQKSAVPNPPSVADRISMRDDGPSFPSDDIDLGQSKPLKR